MRPCLAGRPEELDKYYRTAHNETIAAAAVDFDATVAGSPFRKELAESSRRKKREGGKPVLGIEAILDTAFESRPKEPKRSRRPYAFGSKEKKINHFRSISILYGAHETASERFRNGDFHVSFPEGMYRPPIMVAA
jgi:hypothetical protein